VFGSYLGPVGDSDRQVDHFAELSHVAPAVGERHQSAVGTIGNGRCTGSVAFQKLFGQRSDVLWPFHQWWEVDDVVETVEQRSGQATGDILAVVHSSRGDDDPGVRIGALGFGLVGEELGRHQLLHHGIKGIRALEYESPAVGEVDTAAAVGIRWESASQVLAEDQLCRMVRGKLSAVDGNHRARCALRTVVNQPRDEGFPGSVFAEDEDRRAFLSASFDLLHHRPHARRNGDHFIGVAVSLDETCHDFCAVQQIEHVAGRIVEVAGNSAKHFPPQRRRFLKSVGERGGRIPQQMDIGHRDRVDSGALLGQHRLGAEDAAGVESGQRPATALAFGHGEFDLALDDDVEIFLLFATTDNDLAGGKGDLLTLVS